MINSTNTINIDGTILKDEDLVKVFTFKKNDKFSQWVVRPLAILTVIGMGIAMFFASALLTVLALAMMPFLAATLWAIKTKLTRDMEKRGPVVDTQTAASEEPATDAQAAI